MCFPKKEDQNPLVQKVGQGCWRTRGRADSLNEAALGGQGWGHQPTLNALTNRGSDFQDPEALTLRASCAEFSSPPVVSPNHMLGSGASDQDSNSNSSICDEDIISLVLSFLIYKIDIIMGPTLPGCCED